MLLNLEDFPHIKAVRIWQGNEIIFNDLKHYKEYDLFSVGCIFKSFLSALVGIAIHEGKIGSVKDRITDYYTESMYTSEWNNIMIFNALSKTTGLRWPIIGEPMPKNMSEVFKLPIVRTPGTEFMYKPDPQIIVYLLEDLYEMSISDLFKEKILSNYPGVNCDWRSDNIEGMQVSIRLLDEFGKLYLHKGKVGSTYIFDEDYYKLSIEKYSDGGFPERLAYGLGWWLGTYKDVPYFFASGFGGQILGIIPDKNMTISILSEMDRPHPENKSIIDMAIELVI